MNNIKNNLSAIKAAGYRAVRRVRAYEDDRAASLLSHAQRRLAHYREIPDEVRLENAPHFVDRHREEVHADGGVGPESHVRRAKHDGLHTEAQPVDAREDVLHGVLPAGLKAEAVRRDAAVAAESFRRLLRRRRSPARQADVPAVRREDLRYAVSGAFCRPGDEHGPVFAVIDIICHCLLASVFLLSGIIPCAGVTPCRRLLRSRRGMCRRPTRTPRARASCPRSGSLLPQSR